jgi:DNA primase
MPRYTQDSRERVRDAVDFEELVGSRTELRRAGQRRLQGLCPFHDERTPSFGIDPVEKLYHCFGCGAGGDLFQFVMETEGLDFTGALESLADRYGVELERDAEDPRDAERRQRRDRLLALLERTAAYYVRVLWESPEAADARAYLLGRGLEEGVLREYRVGYAPSAWDKVLTASRRAGYTEAELLACGLAIRSEKSRGIYDRFRRRITFPLCDERGHVLGFGARTMSEDRGPKYLNSSDNEVFHKGSILYGVDLARAPAARAGRVVLVEGYTDAIALRQAGVAEVVGSMGTALTVHQVDALSRLAPTTLFCQDPDAAGQQAIDRSIESLRQANARRNGRPVEFRIVRLPGGSDPADVVQSSGGEAIQRLLDEAVSVPEYQVERALEDGDTSSLEGRDQVLAVVAPVIAPLPASILKQELVDRIAGRLGMKDSTVEAALLNPPRSTAARPRMNGGGGGGGDGRPPRARPPAPDRAEQQERSFLAFCIALPEEGEQRRAAADPEQLFSAAATRRAAAYLRGRLRSPAGDLPAGDEDLARLVAELVIRAGQLDATPASLDLEGLQLDLHRLDRRISAARSGGGEGAIHDLAAERQRVLDEIRHKLT